MFHDEGPRRDGCEQRDDEDDDRIRSRERRPCGPCSASSRARCRRLSLMMRSAWSRCCVPRSTRSGPLRVAATLREILARGTYGAKDVRSFVDHYLRILTLPVDVLEPLERGEMNLFEAEQLARVTSRSLRLPPSTAHTRRRQLLRA